MKKAVKINRFIQLLLLLIFSICLFLELANLCLRFTLLNQSSLISSLNASKYYSLFSDKLNEAMSEACLRFDIMPMVLEEYVNESTVKAALDKRINAFYKKLPVETNSRFYQFEDYVIDTIEKQSGAEASEALITRARGLSASLEGIWMSSIEVPMQNLLQFLLFSAKPQLQRYVLVAALFLWAALFLYPKSRNLAREKLHSVCRAMYGSALSCIVSGVILLFVNLPSLMPQANLLYSTYAHWVNKLPLTMILFGAAVLAIVFLAEICVTAFAIYVKNQNSQSALKQ